MTFIVIERSKIAPNELARLAVFGPFKTDVAANDFANKRIATLADEWDAKGDGMIADCLEWCVKEISGPS